MPQGGRVGPVPRRGPALSAKIRNTLPTAPACGLQKTRHISIPVLGMASALPCGHGYTCSTLKKDAAHARRLAERASDALAQELMEIAEQLERIAEKE